MLRCVVFLIIISFLTSCNPAEKQVQQLMALTSKKDWLNHQTLVTCNIQKQKIENKTVQIQVSGVIIAGIDLSLVTPNSFTINSKSIKLVVPTAKIIAIIPDELSLQNSKAIFQDLKDSSNLLNQLSIQISNKIDTLVILQQTEQNAAIVLQNLLKTKGFKSINIRFSNTIPKKPTI
jgi:hypothetical protein